ncbi:hypothetical protein AX14_005089 [Amanita brunnescens Koide BX004]|nr:hypothetical protein AX14_005089 [Amanita brunnescens Koide BX004]
MPPVRPSLCNGAMVIVPFQLHTPYGHVQCPCTPQPAQQAFSFLFTLLLFRVQQYKATTYFLFYNHIYVPRLGFASRNTESIDSCAMMLNRMLPAVFVLIFLACASFVQGFGGEATWYYTGAGHCGTQNKDSDMIVALSMEEYGNGLHCGKQLKISYNGKTILAMIQDSCPGCKPYDLDLSPAAFKALAPIGAGRITVSWTY